MSVQPYTVEDAGDDIADLRGSVTGLEEHQEIGAIVLDANAGPLGTGDITGPDVWNDTGAMASGWSKAGFFKYKMLPGSFVAVAATLTPDGTSTNKANGSTILVAANGLPAAYRPSTNKLLPAYVDIQRLDSVHTTNSDGMGLSFITDGSVQCYGVAAAATSVICHGIFPVDI